MFRARQKMPSAPSYPAFFAVLEVNESNEVERKVYNQASIELPAVESTDLKALLAAGIDPKQVNTRVMRQQTVVTDLSVESENLENSKQENE